MNNVLKQQGVAGRGAIMTVLNMAIIKDLTLPLPPINVQRNFDQIVMLFVRNNTTPSAKPNTYFKHCSIAPFAVNNDYE